VFVDETKDKALEGQAVHSLGVFPESRLDITLTKSLPTVCFVYHGMLITTAVEWPER
jgi:hypothetical protein